MGCLPGCAGLLDVIKNLSCSFKFDRTCLGCRCCTRDTTTVTINGVELDAGAKEVALTALQGYSPRQAENAIPQELVQNLTQKIFARSRAGKDYGIPDSVRKTSAVTGISASISALPEKAYKMTSPISTDLDAYFLEILQKTDESDRLINEYGFSQEMIDEIREFFTIPGFQSDITKKKPLNNCFDITREKLSTFSKKYASILENAKETQLNP